MDRARFLIERVGEKVHVTDAAILQLWRRNQGIVRHDRLHRIGGVEVGGEHDFSAVAVERGAEGGIAVVRRIEDEIEYHQPRAGGEEPVEEERPDFARPGERSRRHQLERAIISQFAWLERRHLQRALVDSEKDEIVARRRLAPFALEKIFEALFSRPDRRNEGKAWIPMQEQDEAGPEKANGGENQQSMPAEPMHAPL